MAEQLEFDFNGLETLEKKVKSKKRPNKIVDKFPSKEGMIDEIARHISVEKVQEIGGSFPDYLEFYVNEMKEKPYNQLCAIYANYFGRFSEETDRFEP